MNYLASKVVGDEVSLEELYTNLQQQRRIADQLKEELVSIRGRPTAATPRWSGRWSGAPRPSATKRRDGFLRMA